MYQGKVDVAEEDLNSFLEVAEDLNIRGLSERHTEGSYLNEKHPSQLLPSKGPFLKPYLHSIDP